MITPKVNILKYKDKTNIDAIKLYQNPSYIIDIDESKGLINNKPLPTNNLYKYAWYLTE